MHGRHQSSAQYFNASTGLSFEWVDFYKWHCGTGHFMPSKWRVGLGDGVVRSAALNVRIHSKTANQKS